MRTMNMKWISPRMAGWISHTRLPAGRSVRVVGATVFAAATLVTGASAAGAADPTHLSGSFTIPHDTMCGFAGTTSVQFIDNFGASPNGSSYDSGQLIQTFIADNGRGVVVSFAGHEYNAPPVHNPDGTTTLVFIFSEAQNKVQILGGGILQMNAGRVEVTAVLAPDHSLLSLSVVVLAGNNPNPGMIDNCSVIGPYLAGG
jgi:hypothetical protein